MVRFIKSALVLHYVNVCGQIGNELHRRSAKSYIYIYENLTNDFNELQSYAKTEKEKQKRAVLPGWLEPLRECNSLC